MKKTENLKKYVRKSANTLKSEGLLSLGIKVLSKLQKKQAETTNNSSLKQKFTSLVDRESVMRADWTTRPYVYKHTSRPRTRTINWVMSPPAGGGGHQNIFRFISTLEAAGYKNNVYLYSTFDDTTPEQARENIKAYCDAKQVTFQKYNGRLADADVVFATGWETAYPVFNDATDAKKMYFIQDFEPYFYPIGTDYVLAENTYRFGFHGITAGGWLDKKLTKEYGMSCHHYDFGADKSVYQITNTKSRKEVFFYARPVTERRAFDLGIMALEIFHKRMPEYKINLAGWDVAGWDVPFPYVNHGAVSINELSDIYNNCAASLVISLTNMSLMPLELLAAGAIPIVNDGPNNRLVSDNPFIAYAEASPEALAQKMVDVVTMKDLPRYAQDAAKSVPSDGWEKAGDKFLSIIESELKNV